MIFSSLIAWVLNFYKQGRASFEGKQSLKGGAQNIILGYGLTIIGVVLGIFLVFVGLVFKFLV